MKLFFQVDSKHDILPDFSQSHTKIVGGIRMLQDVEVSKPSEGVEGGRCYFQVPIVPPGQVPR